MEEAEAAREALRRGLIQMGKGIRGCLHTPVRLTIIKSHFCPVLTKIGLLLLLLLQVFDGVNVCSPKSHMLKS